MIRERRRRTRTWPGLRFVQSLLLEGGKASQKVKIERPPRPVGHDIHCGVELVDGIKRDTLLGGDNGADITRFDGVGRTGVDGRRRGCGRGGRRLGWSGARRDGLGVGVITRFSFRGVHRVGGSRAGGGSQVWLRRSRIGGDSRVGGRRRTGGLRRIGIRRRVGRGRGVLVADGRNEGVGVLVDVWARVGEREVGRVLRLAVFADVGDEDLGAIGKGGRPAAGDRDGGAVHVHLAVAGVVEPRPGEDGLARLGIGRDVEVELVVVGAPGAATLDRLDHVEGLAFVV